MFLVLSKVLDLLLSPLSWGLLLGAGGLLLRHRRPRAAATLHVLALLTLYVCSTEPVANGLQQLVEAGMESTYRAEATYDVVIILGGALDPAATELTGRPEYNGASERLLRGYELLREGRARQALLSGGPLEARPGHPVEAEVLAEQLRTWGIAAERLYAEGGSRNTRENAVEAERVVRAQGWQRLLLVTSAAHMPRAHGCFAAVGLRPDTLVVDVRAHPWRLHPAMWQPRAVYLAQSTDALRELTGRVVYRLRGWSMP
jgi:uncharacterized SAM-binding protein YcdF (DUF218 family)